MAKDEGKDLGYHWRRAAGVYDAPDHEGPPGNANTTSADLRGLSAPQSADSERTAAEVAKTTAK